MGKRPEGRADKLLEFCVSDAFNDERIVLSAEELVGSFHGTSIFSVCADSTDVDLQTRGAERRNQMTRKPWSATLVVGARCARRFRFHA
jgi:hypothetical protein